MTWMFSDVRRAHDRVDVLDVRACTSPCGRFRSDVCAHSLVGRFGRTRGSAVRDARLGACIVQTDAWLGRDACAHGCVHGSVATHRLFAMHVWIAHGLNFMDDWAKLMDGWVIQSVRAKLYGAHGLNYMDDWAKLYGWLGHAIRTG